MIWLVTMGALAGTVDKDVCVLFNADFTGQGGLEDFWPSRLPMKEARGVYVVILDENDPIPLFYADYVSDGGGTGGCTPVLSFDDTTTYEIRVWSKAKVNGVYLEVWTDIQANTLYSHVDQGWSPAASAATTHTMQVDAGIQHTGWGQLAVGTWAFHRNRMGVPVGETIEFFDDDCCFSGGGKVHAQHDNKYVIAHEIGHAVGYFNDGKRNPEKSYWSPEDSCDGDGIALGQHGNTTKEWQSAAVTEGWADFYAAWLWNRRTESDCWYERHYASDFDLDLIPDVQAYSCEGIPTPNLSSYVSARDWLEDLIDAPDPQDCSGTMVNKGTQYDWMRFFWDMTTDEGVMPEDLGELYGLMEPHSFDPKGLTLTVTDDPTFRLDVACGSMGLVAACDDQSNNGQDH